MTTSGDTMTTHYFEAFEGSSGMACTAMVLRDGHGTDCGLPGDDPIHRHLVTSPTRCYLCGDPTDHGGEPHGEVTLDYLVRADVNRCPGGDFGCTLGEGHGGPHDMPKSASPTSAERWVDQQGDVWHLGHDGLMHTRETRSFPREHVERKWGPLRHSALITVRVVDDINAPLCSGLCVRGHEVLEGGGSGVAVVDPACELHGNGAGR